MNFKKHLISKKQAVVLQQEFIKTRGNEISKILNKEGRIKGEDARDFWFPIDVLKEFILNVEKKAREQGGSKGLGIRIFSGAYPENEKVKDAGYATVFLMAGYENGKDSQEDKYKDAKERLRFEKSSEDDDDLILNLGMAGRPPVDLDD